MKSLEVLIKVCNIRFTRTLTRGTRDHLINFTTVTIQNSVIGAYITFTDLFRMMTNPKLFLLLTKEQSRKVTDPFEPQLFNLCIDCTQMLVTGYRLEGQRSRTGHLQTQ